MFNVPVHALALIALVLLKAKYNVLCGNYPIKSKDALMLGGIVAYVEQGKFDSDVHKPGFFR